METDGGFNCLSCDKTITVRNNVFRHAKKKGIGVAKIKEKGPFPL